MSDLINRCSYFLKNKLYMSITIMIAVAAYGFEIIHAVVGADDICISRYFTDGLGLQIGRWPFFVLSQIGILGLDIYIPFLADFVAVVLLILAGSCWCVLLQRMFSRYNIDINIWCYIAFTGFFISYSMIAYVFIYYLHNGIAIAHLCIALAALLWDDVKYRSNFKTLRIVIILGLVTTAISFYESFAVVFILGLCIYWGIKEFFAKSTILTYIKEMILMCMTLGIAIIGRTIICKVLSKIYDIPLGMRNANIAKDLWGANIQETISNVIFIFKLNYREYIKSIDKNPVMMLDLAIGIVCLFALLLAIRRKNIFFVCHAVIGIASLFIISIYSGFAVWERSTQNMPLFIGFAYFILINLVIHKKWYYQFLLAVILIVLEWNNLCTINFLFYSESKNNERNIAIVNDIGERVLRMGGEGKAVALVGSIPEKDVEFNRISGVEYPTINQNIIRWGENAFNEGNKDLIKFFVLNGYEFYEVNEEQFEEAWEIADELPEYPLDGCIQEEDEYIIVKLGPLD